MYASGLGTGTIQGWGQAIVGTGNRLITLMRVYRMLKALQKPKTHMAPSVPKMIRLSIPQVQTMDTTPETLRPAFICGNDEKVGFFDARKVDSHLENQPLLAYRQIVPSVR